MSINGNRSRSGLNKSSNKLLKAAGNTIIEALVYIFNLSFSTGISPDEMKFAKVAPIYKTGEKSDCSNYRSIWKSFFYNQLNNFLNENTIIPTHQSDYRN